MTCFLGTSVLLAAAGGQITILVTNTVEGMFSQFFYVVIAIAMICTVSWAQMSYVLIHQPKGHSLVNPFDTFSAKDFNLWFVLMLAFVNIYGTMAWQNSQAFNSSAKTPHDSRMGSILTIWRYFASGVMSTILAVCTLTFLQHPDFAAGAARAHQIASQIPNAHLSKQMAWPIALSLLLPPGIKGMLCAIILMGMISGDAMALHSWSSIFIQDVIVPMRNHSLSAGEHLSFLRAAIVGVALFAYCFGALIGPTEKLFLYWALTTGIFVGGAGVAIIGGLYWSRGTNTGAWAGMLIGSMLSFGGLLLIQVVPKFPLNGMQIDFFASLIGIAVYATVSWLTCRTPHDMDRLLHRGRYAVEPEDPGKALQRVSLFNRIIGIDEHFSRSDRWVTIGISGWSYFWFFFFIIGSAVYLIHPWSDAAWTSYWHVTTIWMPLVIGIGTTIWFTIGCVSDLRIFFERLRTERIDATDDGAVRHEEEPEAAEPVSVG
jgi:SSS family solute:Na+ symporter